MIAITTRGRKVEIPGNVGELSPKQYEYYCFLAFALGGGVIDDNSFRVRWFSYLLGFGQADYTLLRKDHKDELEGQIESALAGYFIAHGEDSDRMRLDFSTPINLLPEYKGFKGPGDWLEGVTFGEFTECLSVLESINDAEEDDMAEGYYHIARVLYHIAEEVKVPDILAFHAPMLFGTVWRLIQEGPIEMNGRKIDLSIIFKSRGHDRPDDHTGWTGITFEVATAGLFGSVKEVEATDMWAVLLYLYKCKFEYIHDNNKK